MNHTENQFGLTGAGCRAQLSAQGEALLHMVLDLGMLGFTVGILWLCLRKYKPRALGWFRSRPWPPDWGLKVLLTCAFAFPLAVWLADASQVSSWCSALRHGDMHEPHAP